MSESNSTYEGWSNYETWAVNLWLSNDEGMYHEVREMARRADDAEDLAGEIEGFVCAGMPEVQGLWGDLLTAAVQAVDWDEIAAEWWGEEHEGEEDEESEVSE